MNSHARFMEAYGTGPMLIPQVYMGLVPWYIFFELWDQSHAWLSYQHGTEPVLRFVRPMGLLRISKIMIM